jgi:YVTN family beta-propeller protein
MEFRVLGPLEARAGGKAVSLGSGKARLLLAALILNANRVVSADRLLDHLWGDAPPATAQTALQGHVSALRKALGADVIITRSPGYLIQVEPEDTDLGRFERLRTEARAAREAGDPARAAAKLREALGLWRGDAFSDLADEPAVRDEAARLDDLRLTTLEDRFDCELAMGESAALVDELERAVAAHPLRERLAAQLMLALYRSGRQARALEFYGSFRRNLVAELGIEPGLSLKELERRILAHDPGLEPEPYQPGTRRPVPRRRRLPLAVGALAGALALGALIIALPGSGADERVSVEPNSVVVIDPEDNSLERSLEVDSGPGPVTTGVGFVWVANIESLTVTRIDPRAREISKNRGLGEQPGNVAGSPSEAWVLTDCEVGGPARLIHEWTAEYGGSEPSQELLLDELVAPRSGRVEPLTPVAGCGLAAHGRSVWTGTTQPAGLARINFEPGPWAAPLAWFKTLPSPPVALAASDDAVWAVDSQTDVVRRLDPAEGELIRAVKVGRDPAAVAVSREGVWVANRGEDSVSRIDPQSNTVSKAISVGDEPVAVAAGAGAVWVANRGGESLSRVDPAASRVTATIELGRPPQGVTVAGDVVWVSVR